MAAMRARGGGGWGCRRRRGTLSYGAAAALGHGGGRAEEIF